MGKFTSHYQERRNALKAVLVLGLIICAIPLSVASNEEGTTVSGNIIEVDWPDQDIHASATLVPWVTIKNTGAPTSFNIKIFNPKLE